MIDSEWFEDKIRASEFGSLRGLAGRAKLPDGSQMNYSVLSRKLRGLKEWRLIEVRWLADALGLPLAVVLQRLGIRFTKRDCL